jgi:hypothetical protein
MDGELSSEKGEVMKKRFKIMVLGAATLSLAGCASRRMASQAPPYVPPPVPGQMFQQPPPGAIIVQPGQAPPGAFPTSPPPMAPPRTQFPPPPPGSNAFPVGPPTSPPSTSGIPSDVRDKVGFRWEPSAPPAQRPYQPPQQQYQQPQQPSYPPAQAPQQSASPPNVLLLPPTPEPGTAIPKENVPSDSAPRDEPRKQLYPPSTKEPAVSSLPVGIAGFDTARTNVSTGQRPTLEGLDWLQKSNFRTVLFLYRPGEATDADRQQAEKRGLNFVAIEINPRDLNRDAVERFLRVQGDHRTEKLFVYDLDGSLAGAMWYLSFRVIDQDADDVARVKASSLGQGENRDAARDVWESVRKYVEQK